MLFEFAIVLGIIFTFLFLQNNQQNSFFSSTRNNFVKEPTNESYFVLDHNQDLSIYNDGCDKKNDLTRCSSQGLYDSITLQCKCFQCHAGPACESSTNIDECQLDATSANPVMYEIYWANLPSPTTSPYTQSRLSKNELIHHDNNEERNNKLVLTHDWRIGHYTFVDSNRHSKQHSNIIKDDKHFASIELERSIHSIHSHVQNVHPSVLQKYELVIGVGSTQLTHAALYALEKQFRYNHLNDDIKRNMNVSSKYPYYDEHRTAVDFLPGMDWMSWSEIISGSSESKPSSTSICTVEIRTTPGNPDATMMSMDDHSNPYNCTYIIYDHAYYWPQYTPIIQEVRHGDIMMFTLTKLTGHSGTRIGWAFVKDPEIAHHMRNFINMISHGVPHECQMRASLLLKHISSPKDNQSYDNNDISENEKNNNMVLEHNHQTMHHNLGFIEWAKVEMESRWNRLVKIFANSNRFEIKKQLGPMYDIYYDEERFSTPAYLWIKCNWKQDLEKSNSCQKFILEKAQIIGREGHMYGANNQYARISLLIRPSEFDILLLKLTKLIPLEWTVPVTLYDAESLNHNNIDHEGRDTKHLDLERGRPRRPPRYVVGRLDFPNIHSRISTNSSFLSTVQEQLLVTYDLGNSKQTLLTVKDCLGCWSNIEPTSGCPSIVPSCDTGDSLTNNEISETNTSIPSTAAFCWPSHLNQFVPDTAFEYKDKNCSEGAEYAGTLMNQSVCMQCFDNGNHSRYTISANAFEFSLSGATTKIVDQIIYPTPFIENFEFGALVRTVPRMDRIWSNIGIGAESSFLKQISANSILLDFNFYRIPSKPKSILDEKIIFNPSLTIYKNWHASPYITQNNKRLHPVDEFIFGKNLYSGFRKNNSNFTFHIDTGNNGISIKDEALFDFLEIGVNGKWILDPEDKQNTTRNLFTPFSYHDAPELNIILSPGLKVSIPAWIWIVHDSDIRDNNNLNENRPDDTIVGNVTMHRTIFTTYHKNVFGLPFLCAPGLSFVFDDTDNKLYVNNSSHLNRVDETAKQ